MSMPKSHRLQVLVEPTQHAGLDRVAQARGVSVATVVREAIDREIDRAGARRRAAGALILAAAPIPVPDDPADLEREIAGEYATPR